MNIKRIPIKKLFHGFCSARNYQVEEAKRNGEAIRFELPDGRTMTVPYDRLHTGIENDDVFTSKHIDGLKYKLIDFDFRADPREVQEQLL